MESQTDRKDYAKLREKLHEKFSILVQGIKPEDVVNFYDKWAEGNRYDEELIEEFYNSPMVVANAAADGLTTQEITTALVLDVAAGTGLCAEQLKEKGFKHIDALDPSDGMLNHAKKKNLYENYICEYIGYKTLDIPNDRENADPLRDIEDFDLSTPGLGLWDTDMFVQDSYDLLTLCGGFGEGHIPCNALYEMIRVVKPGGYIVFVVWTGSPESNSKFRDRLELLIDNLEATNKWKRLERKPFERYCLNDEGLLYKYKVC